MAWLELSDLTLTMNFPSKKGLFVAMHLSGERFNLSLAYNHKTFGNSRHPCKTRAAHQYFEA